jgi:hypothetical protein
LTAAFAVVAVISPLAHGTDIGNLAWGCAIFFGLASLVAAFRPDVFSARSDTLRTVLMSAATLCALLVSMLLYIRTAKLSAMTAEDTDQALVLLGRQQLGPNPQIEYVPWAGERSHRAAEHISKGLCLANIAESMTDTSWLYLPFQRQALIHYDSALADPVFLGQYNIQLAKSHRWWARQKLGEPKRRISQVKLPWLLWALFIVGPIACFASFVLYLFRPTRRNLSGSN